MRCASSQMTRSQSARLQAWPARSSLRPAIKANDKPAALEKGLPVTESPPFPGDDVEIEVEFLFELVLPLFDEAPGRDNKASLEIAADNQLFDEKPRHDRLACAGIVGEQEAQRMARQHVAIDCRNLVRQRIDFGGMDCEIGVEEMR